MGRAVGGVDYYELLEVKPGASQAEIKSAHRSLVKVLHPDAGGSQIMFRLVQEAYETLSDPAKRAAYDQRRSLGVPEQRRPRPPTPPEWEAWEEFQEEAAYAEREERPPEPPPQPAGFPSGLRAIPTDTIPWWQRVNPDSKVHWRPGFGWAQRWFFTVAAVWTALLAATVVPMLAGGFSVVAVVMIVPIVYVAVTIAGKATPKFLAVITYIWAAGMAALGIYALSAGALSGIAVVLLAAGVFALPPLGRWYLSSRVTERIFTLDFRTFNLFGAPGTRLLPSEDEPVKDCTRGEWMTLDLLSGYLGQIPAARIFHGLAWPGSSKAEVDHAVLCGRKLLLIESKIWPAGHYTSDGDGDLLRDGESFDGGSLRLARTVAAYQMLLPKVQVEGIVLVHTPEPGLVTCRMPDTMPIEVVSPETFVCHIGGRLADEPAVIERDVFLTLLDQVKA
ncbi:Chaperone protein DnaJ [Kutzneria sp. CA-103260]|nr:Chaperone protein DnaJ [Kutzneria sp. CA-103260]